MSDPAPDLSPVASDPAPPVIGSDLNRVILDALPMSIAVYAVSHATDYRFVFMNRAGRQYAAEVNDDIIGKRLADLVNPDDAARTEQILRQCTITGAPIQVEETYALPQGRVWYLTRYLPIKQVADRVTHIVAIWEDITERKQHEHAEREHQDTIIKHQAATLEELSTPLLAISDTTVVMPLIGTVDTQRVSRLMEALLSGVAAARATYVILDITGVQVVDTQVASAFIRAAQAVQLLGTQLILTGIRPEVAQTLVQLGIELSSMITRGTLQAGIAYALEREQHG